MGKYKKLYSFSPAVLGALFAAPLLLSSTAAKEPVYGNYFNSDYGTREEVINASNEHNRKIVDEGITLLKNEDNALPLKNGSKISIFGKNSSAIINGGSGSGRGSAPTNGNVSSGYNTGETPISKYTKDLESSYDEYSDAAIVVISRIAGEGFDLPRTMFYDGNTYGAWKKTMEEGTPVPGARNKDDHYLQLDQNESDLIKYCGSHFKKVVVLLNTGSQFETGFLDDPNHYGFSPNVKAALWIGYPGYNGMTSLASILKGEVNPSGHTVDTWARDFKLDPVFQNFGNNMQEVSSALKGNQYKNLAASGGNGGGGYRSNYVTYKEGIYMGYRYYETRGFDEGTGRYTGDIHGTTTTDWENWYKANVVYPFGYGLSYTTFTQEIVTSTPGAGSTLTKDGEVKVTVKVTNTGTVAGKDTVQLYYTAPYTKGGIEKSHVVLGAFDKTDIINPGESATVTLTLKAQDMASFDFDDANNNGFKGYELEKGDYVIRIMDDAHTEYDNVTLKVAEDIKYEKDGATGNTVAPRYEEVSNYITDYQYDDGTKGIYFSRANWKDTFPKRDYKLTASQKVKDELTQWDNRAAKADEGQPYYTDVMPTTGASNGLKLKDLVGLDYDDPKWEKFMDQLTENQYGLLVNDGNYASGKSIPEFGITRAPNADGPAGYIYGAPSGSYNFWCSETVLGSTWNVSLSEEKGRLMGNLALWGNGKAGSRICGWYAPACNTHRSSFSGRNFEYFSEDGVLAGKFTANMVLGAQSKGLTTFVKHFGINDQETNRCGLITWLNEQSMREIYLKPFEITVKEGKTRGMMSSLNRIGTTWSGGDYRLLTQILREEWGFNGCVVTDSYMGDNSGLSNANQMIRAGGNLSLGNSSTKYNAGSATTVSCLRKAAKGILYANANSNAMNKGDYPTKPSGFSSFTGGTLKTGVMNVNYSASVATATLNKEIHPDGSNHDIKYSLSAGNTLPKGLFLNEDGTITGVPTAEVNNHLFKITATYQDSTIEASFTVSIICDDGSIVYEAEPVLTTATIGQNYETSVAGAKVILPNESVDTTAKITYSLANGSFLPEGLSLTEDGKIVGTPTKECVDYEFTVLANAFGFKSKSLTFKLTILYPIEFASKELTVGKLGVAYSERIAPATSINHVTYSLKAGSTLPKGLTLTKEGYITGTPSETVTDHEFTVVASAEYSETVEANYKISIGLKYNRTDLTYGKQGETYSAKIDTAQGAGEITYALKEGSSLPKGLTLKADGTIEGTPSECGTFTFSVISSSEGKVSDEMEFTLFIANADPKPAETPNEPAKPSENDKDKGMSSGAIAGTVIGSVAGIAAIVGAILFLIKQKK